MNVMDAEAVMLTRAMRNDRELDHVPMVVQLANIESKEHIQMKNTRAISMDEVKLSLLARSTTATGISTLICNLLTSVSDPASDENRRSKRRMPPWKIAYHNGQAISILSTTTPDSPVTLTLSGRLMNSTALSSTDGQ